MDEEPTGGPAELDGPIRVNGVNLSLALRAANLSQARFAKLADLSEGHISRVINGQGGVSVEAMARMLDAFENRLRFRDLAVIADDNPIGDETSFPQHRLHVHRTVGGDR